MAVYIQLTQPEQCGPITHYKIKSWIYDIGGKIDIRLTRCYPQGGRLVESDRPDIKFKIEGSDFVALTAIPVAYPSQSFLTDATWILCNFLVNKKFVNGTAEMIK